MLSRTAIVMNRRIITTTTVQFQKISCRSIQVSCRTTSTIINRNLSLKLSRYSPIIGTSFLRHINTDNKSKNDLFLDGANKTTNSATQTTESLSNVAQDAVTTTSLLESTPVNATPVSLLDKIPDAPIVPPEALETLSALAEPTFKELGLGSWTPVGIIQQLFEYLHVGWDVPWWGTIIIGTIVFRTLMTPLIILSQRNAAKLHNTLPVIQGFQAKISEGRQTGDHMAVALNTRKMLEYMKKEKCSPWKSMLVPLCQAPIFISFFFALKKMADLPVESLKTGGIFWFENLAVADAYYMLPILTAGTLALTIKLGVEGPQLATMGMMRYVIQGLPLITLPFTINFPAAITLYWTTTNVFSMVQVMILRIPKVRELCQIPAKVKHAPGALPPKKKFKEGFKEAWTNSKLAREMQERDQIDMVQFNRAGRGPITKTYSYNPVKQESTKTQVLAKKS